MTSRDEFDVAQHLRERGLLDVARDIADAHHVTLDEILGRDRTPHHVRARVVFWAVLRARGLSYPAIGRMVGRDHTSVIATMKAHARRAVIGEAAE